MADRFYITGLPRSRTAWLSRLFTFGDVACLHDASVRKEWWYELDEIDKSMVGNSDSGLLLNREGCENGRWLIVKRDPADSLRSFLAMPTYPTLGPIPPRAAAATFSKMVEEMEWLHNERRCMSIDFDDLDDKEAVKDAWGWLVGDVEPWCEWHWNEMRHLRIVVRPETYTEI